MEALVRKHRDILFDIAAVALIIFLPLALIVSRERFGLVLIPLTESDIITILTLAVIVLALNLIAGYTGIPHFGLHLFVYIGAFGLSSLALRLYIVLMGFTDKDLSGKILSDEIISKYAGSLLDVVVLAADRSINLRVSDIVGSHAGSSLLYSLVYLALGLLSAVTVSVILAVLLSIVTLRLRGDYLAIFSLILAELLISVIFHNTDILGGGAFGVSSPKFFPDYAEALKPIGDFIGLKSTSSIIAFTALALMLVVTYFYLVKVSNSPMGRLLRGIRDDELVVSMFGREVGAVKMRVLIAGCIISSIAGALYTIYNASVIPRSYDRIDWTFLPWTMMILGGMANNRGVIIGSLLVYLIRRISSHITPAAIGYLAGFTGLSIESYVLDQIRALAPSIVTGVILILVLYLRPQGLLPEEPSKTIRPRLLTASLRQTSQ